MNFQAGRLQYFIPNWEKFTSDKWLLDTVSGCSIEFNELPQQPFPPREIQFNQHESKIIDAEISKLLAKKVIIESVSTCNEYISNIFTRPKKDGSFRLILNLRYLNEKVQYRHFKMESLHSALNLMTKDCFMASIDYKDAYYSVPIAPKYQQYLKFTWRGKLFQFTCLPNGLASAPRIFTKITKPLFSHLRKQGHLNTSFIDDSLLLGDSVKDCRSNVIDTATASLDAGFILHPLKSVFEPVQIIVYLGFILNSILMTVMLTPEKAQKLLLAARALLLENNPTIRAVAHFTGLMVASFPGVPHGKLFYRLIDNEKNVALKFSRGNFEAKMYLSQDAKTDLVWWIDNITKCYSPIDHGHPDLVLQSDASKKGWGGVFGSTSTGGSWFTKESDNHINYLELKAALLTVQTFCADKHDIHVQIQLDNTTAVAYINNQGGTKMLCNSVARQLCLWCYKRNIWLSATHLAGILNVQADRESRLNHDNSEWQLNKKCFDRVTQIWGRPSIDLFATRLNNQVPQYVSLRPDPYAVAINALSINWGQYPLSYIFPPFCLVGKILQKVQLDRAETIVIAPLWTTQPWFSMLIRMLIDCPFLLPRQTDLLSHPSRQATELPKMRLMACRLSGRPCKTQAFQRQLQTLLCPHGEHQPSHNIPRTSSNGDNIVLKGMQIHFHLI